jgi:hypothetical protein
MPNFWGRILAIVITVLVLSGLVWLGNKSKPVMLEEGQGAIRPGRASAWFTVIVGSLMCIGALWISALVPNGSGALAIAIFTAAIAGFMAPSVTSIHAVFWNDKGIEGPAKLFGPTLGRARTEITWTEIVKTGKTVTGYWYVESSDRRRVYWSYLYKGYGELISELQRRCPSLQLRF